MPARFQLVIDCKDPEVPGRFYRDDLAAGQPAPFAPSARCPNLRGISCYRHPARTHA